MARALADGECDEETVIYLTGITTSLEQSFLSFAHVCVCVCFCVMCFKSELPSPVTHTSFLHACVLVCFSESKCVTPDAQTSDSMLGMRR